MIAATTVVWQQLFPVEQCRAFLDALAQADWADGQVAVDGGAGVTELRRTDVLPFDDPGARAQLQAWLLEVNRSMFGFDVEGFSGDDPLMFLRYRPGGHYGWHVDAGTPETATRKLSFTVQLSPPEVYDGGDLELAMYSAGFGTPSASRDAQRGQGVVTVFPSFQLHRVTPVTRGERLALVGWIHGPAFR